MTVSSTTNRKTFAGNGVTTSFGTSPVTFFDTSDLVVYVSDDVTGAITALVENTDYTASGGDGSTGTINLAAGSSPYGAPAADTTLVIVRVLPLTQEVDLVNNDINDAEVQEGALDKLTMLVQQLNATSARAVRLADSDPSDGDDMLLPQTVDRASKALGFDALGAVTVFDSTSGVTTSDNVTHVQVGTGAVARTAKSKMNDRIDAADYDTFAHAVAAAAGKTLVVSTAVAVPANITVPSTVTLAFEKGGTLVPAAAVTVTIQGAIEAGIQQIFNLAAASSHVDCIAARVDGAYVEWWGVVGGDAAFSSGNAATNKPLIDEAVTYGPYRLLFRQKGMYSTTGHILSKSHKIEGYPLSATNLIIGSGIAFSDAANVTGGDYSATKLYVFQNGPSATAGDKCAFEDVTVWGSDNGIATPTVIAIGVLASSTAVLGSEYDFVRVTTRGFMGQHFTKSNGISLVDCSLNGTFAAIGQTCPSNNMSGGSPTVVQKMWLRGCTLQQLQASPSSGQIVYQHDARGDAPSAAITNIVWDGCTFEAGYDGFVLAAAQQTFISPHMERISHTLVQGETASYRSVWVNPTLDVSTATLLAAVGTNSMVITSPDIYQGATQIGGSNYPAVGTWTPTLTCGTSGTITIASPSNAMTYTKLNKLVHCSGLFSTNAISSPVGTLILGGLPFAIGTGGKYRCGGSFYLDGGASTVTAANFLGASGAATLTLYTRRTSGILSSNAADIDGSTDFAFDFFYFTD